MIISKSTTITSIEGFTNGYSHCFRPLGVAHCNFKYGVPESLSHGTIHDEIDGAVQYEEEIVETDEDHEGGWVVEATLGKAELVMVLGIKVVQHSLERKMLSSQGHG